MKLRIRLREFAESSGGFWDIDQITHVGSADGLAVRLSDPSVSRHHALLRRYQNAWVIRDLDSTHGTFLNEDRLDDYRALGASDHIRFGNVIVEVESIALAPTLFDDNWDSCDDPTDMIDCWGRGTTTKRKWRLLALACLRLLWAQLDGEQRRLVEEAERVADEGRDILPLDEPPVGGVEPAFHRWHDTVWRGQSIRSALSDIFANDSAGVARTVREGVTIDRHEFMHDYDSPLYDDEPVVTLRRPTVPDDSDSLVEDFLAETYDRVIGELQSETAPAPIPADNGSMGAEPDSQRGWIPGHEASLADLLRCIFPNPFRPPPAIYPYWLAWNDHSVHRLAQAMHDEGAFDQLPILADALMDAGCSDADILAHLQQPGNHAKGCWVIDLLLDKA